MSKKITILLLAFMLTSCANSKSSDSQSETEVVSETTTTAVTTTDDSEQTTTTTTEIAVTSAKEKESETTTSKVTSGSQSTTADSTMSTTTTTAKASQMTTVSGKAPASSVQRQQPRPATTTTTTTAKPAAKPQPQSNVVWSQSMKVWRKLCEAKTLIAAEQEMIRSEIASYASKFQGKTKIHVSFANDSYDITYPKPINMMRKKDMVDWTTNAHFDASVDMDCRGIINYAKSEKEIYDVVAQTRNDALHLIDHGLHSRYELFTGWGSLDYANKFYYNVGFDGTYLWFLTEEV